MSDKKDKIELSTAKFKIFQAAFKNRDATRKELEKKKQLEKEAAQLKKEKDE